MKQNNEKEILLQIEEGLKKNWKQNNITFLKKIRNNFFLLTFRDIIANGLTKERVILGLEANYIKHCVLYYSKSKEINLEIKDLEDFKQLRKLTPEEIERLTRLKEEKEFSELPKEEQNLKYYVVVENYKETNEQHIHVFIQYPRIVSYTTKDRVQKLFGILNLCQAICIPHVIPVQKKGYTYVIQYLMKEDTNPLFNFQPQFLISVLKTETKIDKTIKEKLLQHFFDFLNKINDKEENKKKIFENNFISNCNTFFNIFKTNFENKFKPIANAIVIHFIQFIIFDTQKNIPFKILNTILNSSLNIKKTVLKGNKIIHINTFNKRNKS